MAGGQSAPMLNPLVRINLGHIELSASSGSVISTYGHSFGSCRKIGIGV
jgi:hypothetical protein